MLAKMVDENYATEENENDLFVMALYLNLSGTQLKEEFAHRNFNKLIIYQLEPLVEAHWWTTDKIVESLKGADEVWDYDLDNIELLKQHGIEAKFKPLLYTESLNTIKTIDEPDIDVLFYGTPTRYRSSFFESFNKDFVHYDDTSDMYGIMNIVTLYNIADQRLDEFIARSKIVLNLNPIEGDCRQQQTRIFYPLTNGKCVMSQKSNRNYFGNCIVEFTDSQDFGEKAIELLKTGKWRDYPKFPNSLSFSKDRQDSKKFFNRQPLL